MRELVVVPRMSTYGLRAKGPVRQNESSVKDSSAMPFLDALVEPSRKLPYSRSTAPLLHFGLNSANRRRCALAFRATPPELASHLDIVVFWQPHGKGGAHGGINYRDVAPMCLDDLPHNRESKAGSLATSEMRSPGFAFAKADISLEHPLTLILCDPWPLIRNGQPHPTGL